MQLLTIILIALGLAMDAFAVSVTSGITLNNQRLKNALKIAIFFGGFQALMPIFGWLVGYNFRDVITEIDHWVAFGLLSFIGCKMIFESMKKDDEKQKTDFFSNYVLLTLAIATSIDALVVGISFAFLNIDILMPVIIIGSITFILSFIGVYLGNRIGEFFKNRIGIIGGIILIGIGLKILIEHLF